MNVDKKHIEQLEIEEMESRVDELLNNRSEITELVIQLDQASTQLKKEREENRKLHQEIGKYTNRLFDISKENYRLAEQSKQLINEMLNPNGGNENER